MNQGLVVLDVILHRSRRLYLAVAAYLLFLVCLAKLPQDWLPNPFPWLLAIPFMIGMGATVLAFFNLDADLASPASAYSPWLLRMPIKTAALALLPIVTASGWVAAGWIAFSTLYLRPRGIDTPVWWPAAMLVALVLSFQAILWTPVRRGAIRLFAGILMPMAIVLWGLMAMTAEVAESNILYVYLTICVVSAAAAWLGLTRARASTTHTAFGRSDGRGATVDLKVGISKKPFKSPQAAQFWLEFRRQGRLLPALTAFGLLALSLPLFWAHDVKTLYARQEYQLNIWVSVAIAALPWIAPLFATAIGMGARPSDVRGPDGSYHLYFATRPIASLDLYRAKVRSIVAGVLLSAALTIATMLAWVWLPFASVRGTPVPYARFVFESMDPQVWLLIVIAALVLTLWTWRNQAVGAFVDYMPSRKWSLTYPFIVLFVGISAVAVMQTPGPHLQSTTVLAIVLGAVVAAKLGTALGSALRLSRLRPESKGHFLKTFGAWAITAATASGTLGWIVWRTPASEVPAYLQHPVPEFLGIVLVPLARPFIARIALEYGRHRS